LPDVKGANCAGWAKPAQKGRIAARDVPTSAEARLPGYKAAICYGIFPPAGALQPLIDKIHAGVDRVVRSTQIAKRFAELGAEPQFGTPQEFRGLWGS